jgi:hypothetical protein
MDEETRNKIFGIFIAVAMFGSLIAAGFIYADPDQLATNPNPNSILDAQPNSFNYSIDFDTNVLKELNSIRFAAETNETNKNDIDITIRSMNDVSRVNNSQFITQDEGWYYLAEVDLSSSADIDSAVEEILSLDYFNGTSEVMKRVTISVPDSVTVYNNDLNIDRLYNFSYDTSVALVNVDTLPGDEISVSGDIRLTGNNVESLSLVESFNSSNQAMNYSVEQTLEIKELENNLFIDGTISKEIDQNLYTEEFSNIDSENQIFFFNNDDNSTSVFGQTSVDNVEQVNSLFSEFDSLTLSRPAVFELSEVYIEDINSTINLDQNSFTTRILYGKEAREEVDLEILISVGRNSASVLQAVEN